MNIEPANFGNDSEQFQFFSKLWEFGKYAASCEEKIMYLNIGKIIFEELKYKDFEELRNPLNGFYSILKELWNIDEESKNWEYAVKRVDDYTDSLPIEQQKFMADIFCEVLNGLNIRCNNKSKSR